MNPRKHPTKKKIKSWGAVDRDSNVKVLLQCTKSHENERLLPRADNLKLNRRIVKITIDLLASGCLIYLYMMAVYLICVTEILLYIYEGRNIWDELQWEYAFLLYIINDCPYVSLKSRINSTIYPIYIHISLWFSMWMLFHHFVRRFAVRTGNNKPYVEIITNSYNFIKFQWHQAAIVNSSVIFMIWHICSGMDPINKNFLFWSLYCGCSSTIPIKGVYNASMGRSA